MKNLRLLTALMVALAITAGFAANASAKEKVEIVYVEWACATASSNVMKAVIEQETDYEVELTSVSGSAMYAALADGDQDAMTTAWLPVTHGAYMDKYEDDLDNLGPNFKGAKIGLVVPKYVEIDSIAELNDAADKFDGEIIGIDPGAGVMGKTEKALDAYNLDNIELVSSSGPMMTATLKSKYEDKEWVAVTGWTPHWKFAKFDLKYLKDPKKVYGEAETINTIARKGLKEDMPEVYSILDKFSWGAADIGSVMAMNMENGEAEKNAEKWVKENQDMVKKWVE
ncbi:MAG: glycine betaine ABC transporter substrate-binding protein [Thermodesulfobacteriota bacterium]